jgi:drug/metabolite transporter (DMT)-like permease
MSHDERSPLLLVKPEEEEHHRENYEPEHMHGHRQHDHHNHHHPHHHDGFSQTDIQEPRGAYGEDLELGSDGGYSEISDISQHRKMTGAPEPFTLLGYAFAVLAGLCFTASNVMVKFVPFISTWQLLFVRCILQLLVMIPTMFIYKANPMGTPDLATRWRIFAQGILGGFLLLAIFQAVSTLPLGDATAIFFSSPACTMVLSTIILKDHCGLFRTMIAIVLLGGVVILSRPPALFPPPTNNSTNVTHHHHHHRGNGSEPDRDPYQGEYEWMGITAALMVPLLSAFIVIITRQAKHVHYSVLVFWFGVGGLVVSLVGMYIIDPNPTPLFTDWEVNDWVLSFLVAFVGILGSILMTKAICWVTPSKVMVVRSFEVVAAYILQVTVFDTPTYLSDVGGTLMVVAAVLGMGAEDMVMQTLNWRFL